MSGSGAFEFSGINHLALVCRDMQATVDFYEGILGMPLVKTIELPFDLGQHFFFDCGGGDTLAFFWFPDAAEPQPGISGPGCRPDRGSLTSAIGSMNHVAFQVPADKMEEYQAKLRAAGIETSEIANHDDSEYGLADRADAPGVFVRSVYFQDPDGTLLELAAWTRPFTASDVSHTPNGPVRPAPAT